MIPRRMKIPIILLIMGFILQLIFNSNLFEQTDHTTWLHSALIARKNSDMLVINQGEGGMVKPDRKIVIETDKPPIKNSDKKEFSFFFGVDDPVFLGRDRDALIGLKQGAIVYLPEKQLQIKILKVCHDKIPDAAQCEFSPQDRAGATQLNKCIDPKDEACHKVLTKLISNNRTESPEYPIIEYCIVESELMCLNIIEAISLITFQNSYYSGKFYDIANTAYFYLTESNQFKMESLILSKGSLEFASYLLDPNPQDYKPERLKNRLEAAEKNPLVYQKMIEQFQRIIETDAYNAERLSALLRKSGAKLPFEITRAMEIRESKKNSYYR